MPQSTNNHPATSGSLPYDVELDANENTLVTSRKMFMRLVQLLLGAAGDHLLDNFSILPGSRFETNSNGLRFMIRAGKFTTTINLDVHDTNARTVQEAYCRLTKHEVLIVSAVPHDLTWGSGRFGQAQLSFADRSPRLSITVNYPREIYMLTESEFDYVSEAVADAYDGLRAAVLPSL